MTSKKLVGPFTCIGDGSEGDGCGHIQEDYNNGICRTCDKMVLSEQGLKDAEKLIESWKKKE